MPRHERVRRFVFSLVIAALLVAVWPCGLVGADPLDRSPRWTADGTDVIYGADGISDDLESATNREGIARASAEYRYNYCRRGTVQSDDFLPAPLENTANLTFSRLTEEENPELDLFVMEIDPATDDGGPEDCFSRGTRAQPVDFETREWATEDVGWTTQTSCGVDIEVGFSLEDRRFHLFRYLHFPNHLINLNTPSQDEEITSENKKLIVLIHGWNPKSNENAYTGESFASLTANLLEALGDSDWAVVQYHWEADADNGPDHWWPYPSSRCQEDNKRTEQKSVDTWPNQNGTESAEIGHMHGQHLGELLLALSPGLEKVHFIAHSAGSWCARTAARHLLNSGSSGAQVQVTLLDPFMPFEAKADSALGKQIMSRLDAEGDGVRVALLENYYAKDDFWGDFDIPGTKSEFEWRPSRDVNRRIDWEGIPWFEWDSTES